MSTVVNKHFSLLFKYFRFNLKCSMEYKAGFITQVIGMIINNSSLLFFWWVLYKNTGTISGYTFSDVLILWALASSSYGIYYILFGSGRELSNTIITGDLDSFLLQPKDVVINSCASRMEVSAWGDFIYGYILLFISGSFTIGHFILYCIFVITGGMLMFSTSLAVNSLALYLGNIDGIKRIFEMFYLTFATYPESIFGKFLRVLFYTLLPVGFMVYLPVGIIKNFNLLNMLIVFAAAVFYFTASYLIFYKGIKRYESGNLMENKI